MALTLRRWIAIAVLACAMIAVWQLPAHDASVASPTALYRVRQVPGYGWVPRFGWPRPSDRLGRANLRLRVLEIRDSVFTPVTLANARPGLTVLTDHQFPDSVRRLMTAMLEQRWTDYRAGTRAPVVVAMVEDTTKTNDGLPMANDYGISAYVFAPDSSDRTCRVVARVRNRLGTTGSRGASYYTTGEGARYLARSILGPCALYATFGPPGPQIGAWLAGTNWWAAQSVDWTRESPIWRDEFGVGQSAEAQRFDLTGLSPQSWALRNQLSDDAVACTGGETPRCASALLGNLSYAAEDRMWHAHVIDASGMYSYGWGNAWANTGLGPTESWIISDLVRSMGRDQFETFWTSPLPLDSAFQAAAHQPLGTWLETWARRSYGTDVLGPWVPVRARWTGLVVVLLGLGVAMVFARERRVI